MYLGTRKRPVLPEHRSRWVDRGERLGVSEKSPGLWDTLGLSEKASVSSTADSPEKGYLWDDSFAHIKSGLIKSFCISHLYITIMKYKQHCIGFGSGKEPLGDGRLHA